MKVEFTVKIQVETDFNLSEKAFVEIPIFSLKLCDETSVGYVKFFNYVPANFLSCKTIKREFLDYE